MATVTNGNTKLIEAFIKAQGEIKNPTLDGVNPHFGSKYATLKAVCDAVIPVLHKHGIGVFQNVTGNNDGIGVETILVGHGGELRFGPFFIPIIDKKAQSYAGGVTYSRRIGLMTTVGVVGEEDDDGNAASAQPVRKAVSAPRTTVPEQKKAIAKAPVSTQKALVDPEDAPPPDAEEESASSGASHFGPIADDAEEIEIAHVEEKQTKTGNVFLKVTGKNGARFNVFDKECIKVVNDVASGGGVLAAKLEKSSNPKFDSAVVAAWMIPF